MRKRLFLAGLFFLLLPGAIRAQTAVATQAVHVVLVKVRSYAEFEEVRKNLESIPGIHGIKVVSETPDLITLGLDYSDPMEGLLQACQKSFGGSYSVTQKTLPSGVVEINLIKG